MKVKNTEIISIISHYIKDNWYLIFLIIYAICLRAPYPLTGRFAFSFDQGKDLLNTLEMIVTRSPKLVGPWTSISGFYFGPAWYYFLAGCLLIGQLSPAAPVWGMIALSVVQIILVYKYFGRLAATTVAAATQWLTISASAWNPFPLTLVSWLILIILRQSGRDRQLTSARALSLGLLAAWGWHFSSAYALFYPIIILLCWLKQRLIINKNVILWVFIGWVIPFLPQAVFELRHDFPELKALVAYARGEDPQPADKTGWDKIDNLLKVTWGEWEVTAFPNIVSPRDLEAKWLARIFVFSWLIAVFYLAYCLGRRQKSWPEFLVEPLIFVLIPLMGFVFLHFNVWYLLGMSPAMVLVVTSVWQKYHRCFRIFWAIALLLGGLTITAREFCWSEGRNDDTHYVTWQRVWQQLQTHVANRPYRLYTYRSDIYDYNIQYLAIREAMITGRPLPTDFAYKPGETAYLPFKPALTADLPVLEGSGEAVFFILDHPDETAGYIGEWRSQNPDFARAHYLETVGANIQLWEATPASGLTP